MYVRTYVFLSSIIHNKPSSYYKLFILNFINTVKTHSTIKKKISRTRLGYNRGIVCFPSFDRIYSKITINLS